MRNLALACNVVLFGIVCLLILNEGMPAEALYRVFTVLALLTPVLTLIALLRFGATRQEQGTSGNPTPLSALARYAVAACNLLLLGFTCWASVVQYPYPEGNSIIPFVLLMALTPVISLVALFLGRTRRPQEQPGPMARPQ